LLDSSPGFDERDLTFPLGFQSPFDVREGIHVLDFCLGAQLFHSRGTNRKVCIDPEASLLHAAVTHARIDQDLAERREVRPCLCRRTEVGFTDDFCQRSAGTIEIDGCLSGNPIVQQLSSILLHMKPGDPNLHTSPIG
jgi:hypothetical protein